MTEKAKLKEEVKKEIRSLLLSAPLGLTIQELKRDFNEFVCRPLPWKELGYSNPEDFIQDIPDVAKVTWGSTGMVLKPVANASTKHIEKMVSCQKVDSKMKQKVMTRRSRSAAYQPPPLFQARRGGGGGWAGQQNYNSNNRNQSLPPRMQQQHQQNQRQRAKHLAMPPSVPAYVRGQISSLVSQHPQGLPLTHICSIYRSRYGVPLDFRKMGFSTEQDLLASLRDIIGMRHLAGGETRVMSLEACVAWDHAKLRGDSDTGSSRYNNNYNNNSNRASSTDHTTSLSGGVNNIRPLLQSEDTTPFPQKTSAVGKGRGRGALRKDRTTESAGVGHSVQRAEQVSPPQASTTDSGRDSLEIEQNCNIPVTVQNEIRLIMSKRPKGVCASRLPFEYKDMFGKSMPTKTYGYNSVIEFVSDLPHIVRIERPHPQGDWHLFPTQPANAKEEAASKEPVLGKLDITRAMKNSASTTAYTTPSPPPLEVDNSMRESVAQVLCISPDGIPLDKFQETYQAVTGKTLHVAKYGPGGLKRILHSMSDILIISLDASDNAIVLPKMHSGPRRFDQLQDQFRPVATSGNDASSPILHLPNDAVSPGCKYRPQPVPAPSADGSNYIELYVSNVISPDTFWIQLRGRKTTLALEDLMDELESVYSSKNLSKEYDMSPVLAQKGMLCAVIFPEDSFWHRGFITGFKDQLYQVYYVDYGNTCYVSIDQMKLLKTKFLKLPAQAIQARLGHIKPIGGVWNSNSRERLLSLAREKPLVGLVVAEKDRVLSLCLTDTSKAEDIHFNDVFVDEGYAVFEPDGGALLQQTHEQAPSSTFLYGADSEAGQGGQGDYTAGDAQPEPAQRYVRQAQMMDEVTMNLVNLHGQLYLTSGQISALFFQQDVISAKLRQDKAEVPKIAVDKKSYPDLFSELQLYDCPGVDDSTEYITLFSLTGLPLMLELYSKNSEYEDMKATALEILQWFDPDDPFWKGEDDAASTTTSQDLNAAAADDNNDDDDDARTHSSADDSIPSLEDLQLVLKSMEIKRKRILSRMMSESPTAECVNELNTVELHIKRVEALISKLESESATSSSSAQQFYENDQKVLPNLQPSSQSESNMIGNPVQTKTTHKVAPMVQAYPSQPPKASVQPNTASTFSPGPAGDLNPPPLMPAATDMAALLQQQMLMNQMMMMQQLGLSAHLPNPAVSMPSATEQQQLQMQQGQMLHNRVSSASTNPNSNYHLAESSLQGSQLLSQQQQDLQAINARLAALGMTPTIPSKPPGQPSNYSTTNPPATSPAAPVLSVPPGLVPSSVYGVGRGRLLAPSPALSSQVMPQQQPNFSLSAFHRQQQH